MSLSPLASPTCVFVHGFLGFHTLRPLGFPIEYFRKLEAELRQQGLPYLIPTLPPTGTIEERAQILARHLAGHGTTRIVLVGHSRGGLDSRYLIHFLDPDHYVYRLVTFCQVSRGQIRPPLNSPTTSILDRSLHALLLSSETTPVSTLANGARTDRTRALSLPTWTRTHQAHFPMHVRRIRSFYLQQYARDT